MRKVLITVGMLCALISGSQVAGTPITESVQPEKSGVAVYYSPGVMERVAAFRGLTRPPIADGMAAVTDCSQIGKIAFASINGGLVERYLIVDCSQPRDVARHIQQNLVIEVDYQSAVRNNFHRDGRAPAVLWAIGSLNLGQGR